MNRSDYATARAALTAAATAYYADGTSLMTDHEFDTLMAQVTAAEAEHPEWANGSPVSTLVGAGTPGGDIAHSTPMLSLDNVYTDESLIAWMDALSKHCGGVLPALVAEPKLDGLAASIRYLDGEPVQMVTRGDGTHGEDVTYALACIDLPDLAVGGTPKHLFTGEVRGEVIFTAEQFEDANTARTAHGDAPFANARNGVAGALRGAKNRPYRIAMSFYAYDAPGLDATSHTEAMDMLGRYGFNTALHYYCDDLDGTRSGSEGILSVVADEREHAAEAATLMLDEVECDGVVIKVDAYAKREAAGSNSRAPRWAVAYKFPPREVTSRLIDIHWQVGRTGVITPRAEIEPVEVGGVTVTYATLHNIEDIERKGFLMGDPVVVVRAGEVIPRLDRPLPERRDGSQTPIIAPSTCPRCGGPIETNQARMRCAKGRDCGLTESIAYAVGRDALDIEGLGKTQVANLVEAGSFTDVASIFEVGLDEDTLIRCGRVAPANAPKIVAQITKAKTAGLARVLTALGIRGTGRSMSRRIAAHFGTMEALRAADADTLAVVDKIGTVKAALIVEELAALSGVIDRMAAAGVQMSVLAPGTVPGAPRIAVEDEDGHPALVLPQPEGTEDITGWSIVVTGAMTGPLAGLSRTQVQELIESRGARAASSVSKNTTLLVVGERAGSKLAKANELGVRVATETQFATMIGQV